MSRSTLLTAIVSLLVPLAVLAASNSDQQYRDCMREAMNIRELRLLQLTDVYHNNWRNIMLHRRSGYVDGFTFENDKHRQGYIREVDKQANAVLRSTDQAYRTDSRNIVNDFRADEKNCNDQLRQRDKDRRNSR